ncbi:MAG: hypothetical protein JOZ81_35095 [Chloroflexi bacterium]|nr:hypothetical protein [Chloroflexota bacterium]
MNRRYLLRASAVASAGTLLTPVLAGSAAAQRVSAMPEAGAAAPSSTDTFFQDAELNYNFLTLLGFARYGLVDVGSCLAIASQITDGDPASVVQAFTAAGDQFAAVGDTAAAAGHLVSARNAYLQAATYTFTATYFLDAMGAPERFAPVWRRQQALWDQGAALLDPPMEKVRIPYPDTTSTQVPRQATTLPGYFFKVDDSGRPRPVLIFNNGSDGSLPFAWAVAIAPALERGYNCLTFYGPGQGLALVDQGLSFRPDWEQVITPVVEYALSRPEVDPARVALMGDSQGGYWVPRAVAFEHRVAAAVADPGVWDVSTSWGLAKFPPPLLQLFNAGNKTAFDQALQQGLASDPAAAATLAFRSRPFGFSSAFDTYTAVKQYALTNDIVDQIRCPMLIASPEGEQFWPGQSEQLYQALPGPKTVVAFTRAEGADLHCEPKAPGLRAQRIFDWLDATLA